MAKTGNRILPRVAGSLLFPVRGVSWENATAREALELLASGLGLKEVGERERALLARAAARLRQGEVKVLVLDAGLVLARLSGGAP